MKTASDGAFLISPGNLFQSFGAAQLKAQSPRVTFVFKWGCLRSSLSCVLRKLCEYECDFNDINWIYTFSNVRIKKFFENGLTPFQFQLFVVF